MFRRKFWLGTALVGSLALFGAPVLAAPQTIGPGSQGGAVAILQADLADLGLYNGPTNGHVDILTASAIEAFKQGSGLGGGLTTVDAGTWSSLQNSLQQRFLPVSGSLGAADLTIGNTGPAVVDLQGDLLQLGYDPGPANGVFMYATGKAVMAFQRDNGLAVTEVVDKATATAIIDAMGQGGASESQPPAPSPAPAPAGPPTIGPGSQGGAVAILQADLADLGRYAGPTSGSFDDQTASAVKAFKQAFGLGGDPSTVDAGTWSSLNNYLQQRFHPVSGSLGTADLTIGDLGPAVVDLQGDLLQLGYASGPANGVFLDRTGQAVMAFQRDHGLAATEVVDKATASAIINAMGLGGAPGSPVPAPTPTPVVTPTPPTTAPEIDGHRILKVIHLVATAYSSSAQDNYPYGATDYFGDPLASGMVAVDPSVIPLKTHLYIEGYKFSGLPTGGFLAQALDTGGAIKGNRVDIYIPGSESYVSSFGIQPVTVYVLAN